MVIFRDVGRSSQAIGCERQGKMGGEVHPDTLSTGSRSRTRHWQSKTFHKACAGDLSAHGLFLIQSAYLLLISPPLVTSREVVDVLHVAFADNGDIT